MSMKSTPCSIAACTTRDRARPVGRLAPDAGAGQLHRAVAEAVDGKVPADAEGVAQLCSGHARGQHAIPRGCSPQRVRWPDGRGSRWAGRGGSRWAGRGDHRAPARADRVEPQRAAHRRDRPPAAPRGRGAGPAAAGHVSRSGTFAEVWVSPRQRARRTAELAGLTATRRRRRPRRGRLRRLRGPDDGGDQRGAGPRRGRSGATAPCPGRHPGETLAAVGARVDRVLDRARGAPLRRRRRPRRARARAARAHRPLARAGARRRASLFALPAGSYGVLGHEHDPAGAHRLGTPLTGTRSTGCQRLSDSSTGGSGRTGRPNSQP